MREPRGLSGVSSLGNITSESSTAYVTARELINQVIAVYSALISTSSGSRADELLAQKLRYSHELQRLAWDDEDAVQRVLREYPALIRELREGVR